MNATKPAPRDSAAAARPRNGANRAPVAARPRLWPEAEAEGRLSPGVVGRAEDGQEELLLDHQEGATTKMDGCAALYPALAAIFVANVFVFGVHLGVKDYLLIAFTSVVGSAATAGLTGAIVMLTLTLSTLGLPLAGAGILLAIDPMLDMGRTAVNVAG
ncbi:hypothetical protein ABH926_007919 [Catenulispora sp. GP43]